MSGGGTPYIGSKISLVSKAKIRYEGYLYTIDTEESTVTLAKVKSFGTENRKVTNKVPARNEIYEYIVFRGSDIDDLHVAAGPNDNKQGQVGEDPAIVQTGNTQPSMYQQQMPVQLGTPFPPQSYGPFGAMPYGYPMGFRPQGNMPLSSVIGPAGMADRNSRSSPFDRYRKSPSPPGAGPIGSRYQSVKDDDRSQSLESGSNVGRQRESQRLFDGQAYPQKVSKEQKVNQLLQKENEIPTENAQDAQPAIRKQSKDNDQQRERHKGYSENREQTRTKDQPRNQESSRSSRKHEWRDPNAKEKTDAKEKNWKKQGNEGQKKTSSETTTKSSTKEVKKETNKEENASNPPSSNETKGHSRGRGRGRGRGGYNKTRQFDKDFDFERANAKFNKEEIEKELLSLKKHVSLKDEDVIVEDGYKVSELDDIEAEVNGEDVYYDKSKSFFDQISCDSVGQSNDSMSRRKERALNVETFGVLTRNYRGRPYRGRGGRGGRSRGYGRGGQNARRGGRGSNRAWVDYDFDFEAAGIRQGGRSHKSGAS